MNGATQPTACVMIIGNEILSGKTQDANLQFLGLELAKLGIKLAEARVVRDEPAMIVAQLNELDADRASSLIAQLPFDQAVDVLDRPELTRCGELLLALPGELAGRILKGMSADDDKPTGEAAPVAAVSGSIDAADDVDVDLASDIKEAPLPESSSSKAERQPTEA